MIRTYINGDIRHPLYNKHFLCQVLVPRITLCVGGEDYGERMPQCTAPVYGHIRGGGADCPVHGGRGGGYYGGHNYRPEPVYRPTPPPPPEVVTVPSYVSRSSGGGGGGGGGGRTRSASSRARRSAVTYTVRESRVLNPVREQVERSVRGDTRVDVRDMFLCHAWDDRQGAALELNNLLTDLDVSVWFSEMDVPLGTSLIRTIDRGLANSRMGIVLVTPSLFNSLNSDGIASQELSALLATDRVIPIVHNTTFEALRRVSPLLAARSGLTTSDYGSLEEVAAKLADTAVVD
jgi:hypothetical protein